jgi:hypothetical protein
MKKIISIMVLAWVGMFCSSSVMAKYHKDATVIVDTGAKWNILFWFGSLSGDEWANEELPDQDISSGKYLGKMIVAGSFDRRPNKTDLYSACEALGVAVKGDRGRFTLNREILTTPGMRVTNGIVNATRRLKDTIQATPGQSTVKKVVTKRQIAETRICSLYNMVVDGQDKINVYRSSEAPQEVQSKMR